MNKKKVELSLLFIVLITLSAGMLLNILYIKSPNDGVFLLSNSSKFYRKMEFYLIHFIIQLKVISSTQIGSSIILYFF